MNTNNKHIYFDNAATTAIYPEVIESITEVMTSDFGNPSSTHQFGRSAKVLLETARKNIAKSLNCSAQEIIFTSGGTEGDNWILQNAVEVLQVKRIITTKVEHHAVLYPIQYLQEKFKIKVEYLNVNESGEIDLEELDKLLEDSVKTFVSLMHVNNETGAVLDLQKVGILCEKYHAFFHSDTVQSMGKISFDVSEIPIHFLVGSAHKFHGPKGVGFIYVRKNVPFGSFTRGGSQEKGLRAGTESVHQIVGMAKAFTISYERLEANQKYISDLKNYAINQLQANFRGIKINGTADAFYTILNVMLPFEPKKTPMLLFNLDLKGIAVSRGSACQSGSIKPSHVLAEMLPEDLQSKPSIRISFSQFNTIDEVDYLVEALKQL